MKRPVINMSVHYPPVQTNKERCDYRNAHRTQVTARVDAAIFKAQWKQKRRAAKRVAEGRVSK